MKIRSARLPGLLALVATSFAASGLASARTWNSVDGKRTFEGDLVSYDAKSGTVTVSIGGVTSTFKQSILSGEDVAHLKGQASATKPATIIPVVASSAPAAPAAHPFAIPEKIGILMENNCWDCHDYGTQKGDIRLDNLGELTLEARLDLLNRAQEQAYLHEMPPKKAKTQPSEEERNELLGWIAGELREYGASKLEEKLRYPAFGNAVDHGKLFSGKIHEAAYTPARRWLVSPQIFDQRVLDVFELEGRDRNASIYGVTNPFLLPDASGVRYYDNGILDGGHLLVMLTNAGWISGKQIRPARVKNGELGQNDFPDPKDKWTPRATPAAFEAVILKKGEPTSEELSAAIRKQFQLVLRRDPTEDELAKYLELTRSSIALAGNTEGLQQMLIAVLLESEFLYRIEFGEGNPDAHGRRMLSPREAAYAISYSIGDRGPDAKLLEAAKTGKLATREDYKREVTRLLADTEYYKGSVDPAFTTGKVTSHITSHPRINRFFREFFGYPMAAKVFKDTERSDGYYQNPDRGTLGTPGFLVDEADRFIDWNILKDKDVFGNLLTSDEYFVYHNKSDEEGAKIIANWRTAYEKLKRTDWEKDPEKVMADNADFIAANLAIRQQNGKSTGDFLAHMYFFEEHFGKGISPFTTIPWAHGYAFNHSPFYSLPPTPGIWRYGNMKSGKERDTLGKIDFWNYPAQQPFRISNRKGILSHPAWLIAHSKNTHNDPVARGKWVREKLLAGRVPDVPITVDAQIPEDPHRTLRARLEQKTAAPECWKCHESMNPLGLPFEIYDDFGRFRIEEPLEAPENVIGKKDGRYEIYKTLKVDPAGELSGTGDPKLDGKVTSALELIDRIAKSDVARQSIIRHAFRFYMGRNEMLSDSQTLIDADKAYVEGGGSFKAVIVSLLTSDSFMYRKDTSRGT